MTSHAVRLLLVDLALILVLARLFGWVAKRLGQPPVIGEIVAGIALGPTFFGGHLTRALFPAALTAPLTALADIGLVLFMFIVGYELDRTLIRGRERVATSVSLGSIALPLGLGFTLGLWLAGRHHVHHVVPFALFVGASMSVTAFPVLARILTDRGLHRTRIGGLAVASAAVDDIAAWSLLAVVVTVAGSTGTAQWHVLLAPVYLAAMVVVVRPLLRRVADRQRRAGRLTPDMLAVVLVGLLLSCASTEWMGVHFIFGGFIFGAIMPREGGEPLREAILERLEQVSVLLLLPVFFVVSGIGVNLSTVRWNAVLELLAILAAAIVGKFVGAYLGARSAGVPARQAGVLATLMNTRGLTEIVILTVGRQLGVLDTSLFSLMVVMAVVTTAMTGPLLRLLYPPRLVQRDLADAERAALGANSAYRVLAVVDSPDDVPLVDLAVDLAAARRPSELVLSRLVEQRPGQRLELGSGLGSELLAMTRSIGELHTLAARGTARGVTTPVHSRFSEDVAADLSRQIDAAAPALVVLDAVGSGRDLAQHNRDVRTVTMLRRPGPDAAAVAVRSGPDADAAVALEAAAMLAVGRGVGLVVTGPDGTAGRRERHLAAELARHGLDAVGGEIPPDALVVVAAGGDLAGAHVVVRARIDDETDAIEDWATRLAGRAALGARTTVGEQA